MQGGWGLGLAYYLAVPLLAWPAIPAIACAYVLVWRMPLAVLTSIAGVSCSISACALNSLLFPVGVQAQQPRLSDSRRKQQKEPDTPWGDITALPAAWPHLQVRVWVQLSSVGV
jgi:hypothetical protein